MGCVQSLFKRAQSSGLSPSPTEEAGQKVPSGQDSHAEEGFKSSVTEEKPLEEPESNDTSYGVEATAVRTLAASTGTVAILGTTAKVKEPNEPSVGDLKKTAIEHAENYPGFSEKEQISNSAPQNDTENAISPSQTKDGSDKDTTKPPTEHTFEQVEEKNILNTEKEFLLQPPEEKIEQEQNVEDKIIETEETKILEESTKKGAITEETKLSDTVNIQATLEKEPVRIVDFQEKKDRVHEPKIVEEMSVKKEEKLNKLRASEEVKREREKEFEVASSIDEQDSKEEIKKSSPKKPIEEEKLTDIEIITEEEIKAISVLEIESPEASKTEEDTEISSEQLKTNSLSDMSLSEVLNSDGEELAREAAKALELKQMVASLSATANRVTIEYELSEDSCSSKGASGNNTTVGTSLQNSDEFDLSISDQSKAENVSEKVKNDLIPETPEVTKFINKTSLEPEAQSQPSTATIIETSDELSSEHSSGQEAQNQQKIVTILEASEELNSENSSVSLKNNELKPIPEKSEEFILKSEPEMESVPETIHETAEDTISSTENLHDEKDTQKSENEEGLATPTKTTKRKKTEDDNIEEKEKDETEVEIDNIQNNELEFKEPIITTAEDILPDQKEVQLEEVEQIDDTTEKIKAKEESEITAAATAIQSGFRGYIVRKHLKDSEMEKEIKLATEEEETEKSSSDDAKTLLDGQIVPSILEIFQEKGQIEEQEKNFLSQSESKVSEADETAIVTTVVGRRYVPESLMKIAQAEVDKICREAEKATESLMTPPLMKDESDRQGIDILEEEFPAPPDELLTSDSQNEEVKEERSSSGTQSTEPTMPLGNNTEGDSSKTEDTTAPSLAESEIPKSAAQSPSKQNDDFRLESSVTENINTEVALQRDSTEGELTMEEDSTRDDDMPATTQSSKAEGDDSLTTDEEKAATVIQAGYRGFKTRKRLREESSTGSPEREEFEKKTLPHESGTDENSKKDEDESDSAHSLSNDKSEKELNDSAKKIQAGVRGYLVRKKQKVKRDAAVTIQSHFRGFKTRQRLKQKSS